MGRPQGIAGGHAPARSASQGPLLWEGSGRGADRGGRTLRPFVSGGSGQAQAFGFKRPPTIFSQVPAGTVIHELPSASLVEVPAQECVAVWQSFLPALAMP